MNIFDPEESAMQRKADLLVIAIIALSLVTEFLVSVACIKYLFW